jgi:uncharacterized protein (TIGR02466 family)
MNFNINTIFPTTIINSNINRKITEEEMAVVLKNSFPDMSHKNEGNTISNNKYILNTHKELFDILKFIGQGLEFYINNVIVPKYDTSFYITHSWLNYTQPKEYHHRHAHENSIISGVFYFHAEENVDSIEFYNSKYQRIAIAPKECNLLNSTSWYFPVKTGDLILFPSELEHMVRTTESLNTRISLSFNVFVKGKLGEESSTSALHL